MNNKDNFVNINWYNTVVESHQSEISRKDNYIKQQDIEIKAYIQKLAKLEADNFAMSLRVKSQNEIIEFLRYGSYGKALELLK